MRVTRWLVLLATLVTLALLGPSQLAFAQPGSQPPNAVPPAVAPQTQPAPPPVIAPSTQAAPAQMPAALPRTGDLGSVAPLSASAGLLLGGLGVLLRRRSRR